MPQSTPSVENASPRTAEPVARPGFRGRAKAYYDLGKVRLSLLAVFAVVAGLWLGHHRADPPWQLVFGATFGTFLVAVGSAALNMYLERHLDERMDRTRSRPLPSGRLDPEHALAFGIATSLVGLATLAILTNWLATVCCAAILVLYVGVYTPLKLRTTLNTQVGAIPGALPPVVGYVAASGQFTMTAFVLFLILFFWQVPHFLAIAWRYRDDYRRGGMAMLPSVAGDGAVSLQMVVYCAGLVITTLLPFTMGMSKDVYLGIAICANGMFFLPTAYAAWARTATAMRVVFLTSIVYLPLLFGAMVFDWIRQVPA